MVHNLCQKEFMENAEADVISMLTEPIECPSYRSPVESSTIFSALLTRKSKPNFLQRILTQMSWKCPLSRLTILLHQRDNFTLSSMALYLE